MAVNSRVNYLGQERIDAPFLRLSESGVAGDFDLLAGLVIAGKQPLVVKGFSIGSFAVGTAASNLVMDVTNGLILHYEASASGSVFTIPSDRSSEVLSSTSNARVSGSFVPSSTNYVGLDLTLQPDSTTEGKAAFYIPDLQAEQIRSVPLQMTVDYRIVITTEPFETFPSILPIAIVNTDNVSAVLSVNDARNLLGRLGSGGSSPNPTYYFNWPSGRKEVTGKPFSGGDKEIPSLKDWMNAVMTRIWEIGGGERWCTATADRNVKLTQSGAPFASNNEYFEWNGTNLLWKGLSFIFANCTGYINQIADQTTSVVNLTDLADQECIYADIDYRSDLTGANAIVCQKANIKTLGSATPPLARFIIAVRIGANIFTRDSNFAVGQELIFRLRDAVKSTPLIRRSICRCATSPSLVVQPLGSFFVTEGGTWVCINHSIASTLNLNTISGGLLANLLYYVYAYSLAGVVNFEASTTAPDSSLTFKSGTTTHALVSIFATDHLTNVMPYKQGGGKFRFEDRTPVGGGVRGNLILDGGNSVVITTISLGNSLPLFASEVEVNLYYTAGAMASSVQLNALGQTIPLLLQNVASTNSYASTCSFVVNASKSIDYKVGNNTDTNSIWIGGFNV